MADGVSSSEGRRDDKQWPDARVRPRSFFEAPTCSDLDELSAQVAFLGVPFDLADSAPGARYAPDAFRDSRVYSCMGMGMTFGDGPAFPGYYDFVAGKQRLAGVTMADCGDVILMPGDIDGNLDRISRTVRKIVENDSTPVVIGGDQLISAAVLRGFEKHGAVDVVHFDAHVDFADEVQGVRWSGASTMRRAAEYPWIRHLTQVGLRANWGRRSIDDALAWGKQIIPTDEIRSVGPEAAMARIPKSDAIYVSFNLDVMDPSGCPGVVSPEPGGLGYYHMREALQALARRGRIVGCDVVDVVPHRDHNGLTTKTAARLVIDLLTAIFE